MIAIEDAIERLLDAYGDKLKKDGEFLAEEMNKLVDANLFEYGCDDVGNEWIEITEDVKKLPHTVVKYEQSVIVPEALTAWYKDLEDAFENLTGIKRKEIIYTSSKKGGR